MGSGNVEEVPETLDRLRLEVEDLRASRKRLVEAADDDHRRIERELHRGVQQHLVALAVNLQLASGLAESDPPAAKALIDSVARDVQEALDETRKLAQRIHPPLLEPRDLALALRAAAVIAGIPASVEVQPGAGCPEEIARTVYACCVEALENAGPGARATVTVREQEGALAFAVVLDGGSSGTARSTARPRRGAGRQAHDRVRARPRHARLAGSLPLS